MYTLFPSIYHARLSELMQECENRDHPVQRYRDDAVSLGHSIEIHQERATNKRTNTIKDKYI